MNREIITAIKKMLVVSAGGLGGFVVGCILSLFFFHARRAFEMQTLPPGVVILGTLILCIAAGMFRPRFFSLYFLLFLPFMIPTEIECDTWRTFFCGIAYWLGLVALVFGVITFKSWIVGAGLFGIIIFTIGMSRIQPDANKS